MRLNLGLKGFYFNGGHTAGMAADAEGVFHPLWVDNRTGISQVWTAAVGVKGGAVRNGSAELSELQDVSGQAELEYTNTHYDRANNILSVDARLVSDEALIGPIKVRVTRLQSDVGLAKILNADNGESGVGAVWDFTSGIENKELEFKQESDVKRFEFGLSELRPLAPARDAPFVGLVRMEARVLARVKVKASKP